MREIITNGELGEFLRVNWIITDWFRTDEYLLNPNGKYSVSSGELDSSSK